MTNQNLNSFLTIDATGSFATKLKLINNEKNPDIYLYQCVLVTETTNNPVSTTSNGINKTRCFNNYLFLFKILVVSIIIILSYNYHNNIIKRF